MGDSPSAVIPASLRPQQLDEFIGQKSVVDALRISTGATQRRRRTNPQQAMDHVLLGGPPGLGKTTLAHIIAAELGVACRVTSGPAITRAGDLAALLTALAPADVLFIDEIHRIPAPACELLYPAMEDYLVDIMVGEGLSARSLRLELNPFTLVAATTRTGNLTKPLRDRFGIQLMLSFYLEDELAMILQAAAKPLEISLSLPAAKTIAQRARGTPRIALHLLKRVIDYAAYFQEKLTDQIIIKAMHLLEVDDAGLTASDKRYLAVLAQQNGAPIGLETIAARLNENKEVVATVIEPYLLQRQIVVRTPRGRVLAGKQAAVMPPMSLFSNYDSDD